MEKCVKCEKRSFQIKSIGTTTGDFLSRWFLGYNTESHTSVTCKSCLYVEFYACTPEKLEKLWGIKIKEK